MAVGRVGWVGDGLMEAELQVYGSKPFLERAGMMLTHSPVWKGSEALGYTLKNEDDKVYVLCILLQ